MRASKEQIDGLLHRLGLAESRRRGIDLFSLDRESASRLCRELEVELGHSKAPRHRVSKNRKPIDQLPADKQRLIRRLQADAQAPQHGTPYGYYSGRCRCDRCCSAVSPA